MASNPLDKIVPPGAVGKWIKFGIYAFIAIVVLIIIYKIYKVVTAPAKPNYATLTADAGNNVNFTPTAWTNAVYEDLSAPFYDVHSSGPYAALILLSDTQLEEVYNDWTSRYYSQFNNETLTAAINGSFSIINGTFNTDADNVVKRLQQLNLA